MVNFKPTVFAEGELVYTDGGILAEYAWLLVVLPFVAALVITFTGKYLPLKGAEVALTTIGVIFLYSAALMYLHITCLLYTSPSPRDRQKSRMPSSA